MRMQGEWRSRESDGLEEVRESRKRNLWWESRISDGSMRREEKGSGGNKEKISMRNERRGGRK